MVSDLKNNNRMLITGVSGLLGNNLAHYFKSKYEILGLYWTHPVSITGIQTTRCDLALKDLSKTIIEAFDPAVIVHCASLTNVDQCESNPDITRKINVISTKNIIDIIHEKRTQFVYISTDSVYDGIGGNFSENDSVNPLNSYGRSKYEGELEALRKEESVILRTNLFGWNIQEKNSLGEWLLSELKSGGKIQGFKDAFFSTIYTFELARVIDMVINRQLRGIFNCGGTDSCSKYDFAMKIAHCFGFDHQRIMSISIDDFQFKAKRGKDLSLNVEKLEKALNYKLPTIDLSIDCFYRDYKCALPADIKHQQIKNQKVSRSLSYGRQWIDEDDIQAVAGVLRKDWITQGPKVAAFENALSGYCDAGYAVAVNSGTAALHIACLAAGIGSGDEVITSPNTFVASANCAVYCGATPVFADIDPNTYNLTPETIKGKITENTKAVIAVHFAGQSCEMEAIRQMIHNAEKKYGHKIVIIEDACHALGSFYKEKKVGACAFSDMTVMSFHPVKHITTGEGGVVLSNDENLHNSLCRFRSHGITSDSNDFVYPHSAFSEQIPTVKNPWYYEQQTLGFNYRITDMQCALGLAQLKKLGIFRNRRREIVDIYNRAFGRNDKIQIPFEAVECDSNFHLYVLRIDFDKIGLDRAHLMLELKKRGIQTQVHYIPVHLQPFFQNRFGTGKGDCPNAEAYYRQCLSIPLYPAMNDNDINKVTYEIENILKGLI